MKTPNCQPAWTKNELNHTIITLTATAPPPKNLNICFTNTLPSFPYLNTILFNNLFLSDLTGTTDNMISFRKLGFSDVSPTGVNLKTVPGYHTLLNPNSGYADTDPTVPRHITSF